MKNKKKVKKQPVSCARLTSRIANKVLTSIQARDAARAQKQSDENSKRIGFMDLSAELRNTVYELCLTQPGTIYIGRRRRDPSGWRGRNALSQHAFPRLFDSNTYFGQLELSPNLLVTCKAIHEEATSMLYGSNRFTVYPNINDFVGHVKTFFHGIHSSIKHLRNVAIYSAANQRTLISILKDLESAESLQVLKIRFTGNFTIPRTMTAALFPLMLKLHQARKNSDHPNVLEMLDFDSTTTHGFPRGMADVKSSLEKQLIAFDDSSSQDG